MSYSFLSQPPNKRVIPAALPVPVSSPPPVPSATRRSKSGSHAYSHIHQWAAQIQPGSPAPCSPLSPLVLRRPSVTSSITSGSRRPSLTRIARRPSIGHARATSGSVTYLVHTPRSVSAGATSPTSNPNAEYPDLTAMGYTSVFIHFDKTPTTPSPFRAQTRAGVGATPLTGTFDISSIPIPPIPQAKPAKKVGMKRFKSFGILRSKKASAASVPAVSPTKTSISTKSDIRKPTKQRIVPPTLANELELMQFIDGGSIDRHAERVMRKQAKGAAGSNVKGGVNGGVGVGAVYRDEKGGLWWDADEEMEYAPLLVEDPAKRREGVDQSEWVEFMDSPAVPTVGAVKPLVHPAVSSLSGALERRESTTSTSTSTTHSSLHPSHLLPLPENTPLPSFTSGPVDDRALSSTRIGGTGMSLLSLPSRPRRKVAHLMREPGMAYVVGLEAFGPRSPGCAKTPLGSKTPKSPKSPRFPKSPLTPRTPKGSKHGVFGSMQASASLSGGSVSGTIGGKSRKVRPRPAPLKLTVSALTSADAKVAMRGLGVEKVAPTAAPVEEMERGKERGKDAKKAFIDDSFVPAPPASVPSTTQRTRTHAPGHLPKRPALHRAPAMPLPAMPPSTKPHPLQSHKPLDVAVVAPWTQLPAPVVQRSSTETTSSQEVSRRV
ncbi:hypothetical protein CPB83DRAFT_531035 [Crepidotus variabilis]|uniref:Uncharacterized protein n=1 Tax=Crepidotus variabilis TaxID=179855 RepID=A0A9P6JUN4_9AGAR|nr:hypothetical protein CPB83DRAFT_531035 [Crepidotus variabilis]